MSKKQIATEEAVPADESKQRTVELKESARVNLTTEQLLEAGRELASSQSESRQLEDDFKSVRDEWKSRISSVEARITATAGRISRGYDIKPVACVVTFDEPEAGLKTCIRQDTGERLWVREMTESDKQLVLDFEASEQGPLDTKAIEGIAFDIATLAKENGIEASKLLEALEAIKGGVNTVSGLQRSLRVGYTTASKIFGLFQTVEKNAADRIEGAEEADAETPVVEGIENEEEEF